MIPLAKPLPKHEDLILDKPKALLYSILNAKLNRLPNRKWIKSQTIGGREVFYLPIEKVEYLLTKIFGLWYAEVVRYEQVFNAVTVHVRLHLVHPYTGEPWKVDGVGAEEVQTKKGAAASDLANINTGAVAMAFPAAKSEAIKNAAKSLGKYFGRDLNRKDTISSEEYENDVMRWAPTEAQHQSITAILADCSTVEQVREIQELMPDYDLRYFENRIQEICFADKEHKEKAIAETVAKIKKREGIE